MTLLVIAVASCVALFEWYKPDVPHRMAAIKQLEEAMPEHLSARMLNGFKLGKPAALTRRLTRYFRQLDLPGGERKCLPRAADCFFRVYSQGPYEE